MAHVEVTGRGDYDMTWFKGGVLAPVELAERLASAFPSAEDEITVRELAQLSGRSTADVLRLLPVMVTKKLVLPVAAAHEDSPLSLGPVGRSLHEHTASR